MESLAQRSLPSAAMAPLIVYYVLTMRHCGRAELKELAVTFLLDPSPTDFCCVTVIANPINKKMAPYNN